MAKIALLLGGSGLVGGYCLEELLASELYSKVIALSRKELSQKHEKLQVILGDLDTLDDSLSGLEVDHIYCCLGTTIKKAGSQAAFKRVDYDYSAAVAQYFAGKADAFVVVSAIGANSSSKVFYSKVKGELEDKLVQLEFKQLNILQPSLITGPRKERRVMESLAIGMMSPFSEFMLGFLSQYRPRHAKEIAKAMVVSLTKVKGPKVWRIRSQQIGELVFIADNDSKPEKE